MDFFSSFLALMPTNLTFEEAAVIPSGGITTLSILKMADIQPGQQGPIYSASGSVGTFAVQLATANVVRINVLPPEQGERFPLRAP